eukprot:1627018-Rhodomonas_salina.2
MKDQREAKERLEKENRRYPRPPTLLASLNPHSVQCSDLRVDTAVSKSSWRKEGLGRLLLVRQQSTDHLLQSTDHLVCLRSVHRSSQGMLISCFPDACDDADAEGKAV